MNPSNKDRCDVSLVSHEVHWAQSATCSDIRPAAAAASLLCPSPGFCCRLSVRPFNRRLLLPRCYALLQAPAVASLLGPSPGCCCRIAARPFSRLQPRCSTLRRAAAAASLLSSPPGGCYPPPRLGDAAGWTWPCLSRNAWAVACPNGLPKRPCRSYFQ